MPERPSRLDNLKTLRYANLDGAFSTAFGTLLGGSFLVGFIKLLHGDDLWIGLLSAIPSLLGILQIPGAIWGRGFTSFKRFVTPGGLIWRLLYIPVVFLPLAAISNDARLWLLTACVLIGSASVMLINPIYSDWIAEMVPTSSRGWFFSRRTAILTAVGSVVGLVGGLLIDHFRQVGQEHTGFATIFALGSVCAFVSFFFYTRMRDIPRENPIRQSLWDGIAAIKTPFADRSFRKVLVFFVFFIAGQGFAGNLFSAFALETLGLPFTTLQLMGLSHAVSLMATAGMWGFLADKYGNKPLLGILGVGLVLTPAMWLFCHPDQVTRSSIILICGHLFTGAIWGGIATTQFNLLLATAKPEDRANYIGAGMATQAVVGGLAPLLGATLMRGLRGAYDPELAYKAVFVTSMGVRFASLLFLAGVKEAGSRSLRETLSHLRRVSPKGAQAFKRFTASTDAASRETAIRDVAHENYALASSEVAKALHDPSPRVRRQAATALAKLRDPRGVDEIVHMLEYHPDLVEEETIEALGELGGAPSVEVLTRFLNSPRSLLRRASAKSLGRIGDARAIAPLTAAAAQPGDPDLRRAALQALRILGAREAADAICEALYDPHPSVRIAAAEAVSELELTQAIPFLRQSLDWYDDEAASEVAYALGCVGEPSDIPKIMEEARQSVSIITRRRCLLGVARMLVCETEAYRLFVLEGMARDQVLLEVLRPAMRAHPELNDALGLFSSGDERAAVEMLAGTGKLPALRYLAEPFVEESFIVASVALASRRDLTAG